MKAPGCLPLSLDWLSLSLVLHRPLRRCPEGHRWAYYSPTNVWNSRWVLYNDYGDKVLLSSFSRALASSRQVVPCWKLLTSGSITVSALKERSGCYLSVSKLTAMV